MPRKFIAAVIVLILTVASVSGHADTRGNNFTGVYSVRPQCNDPSLDGFFYIKSCFNGARFSEAAELVVVQNSNKICGSITECAGPNCIRVYGGNLVGEVLPGKIRIFYGDSHALDGLAQAREFVITPRG